MKSYDKKDDEKFLILDKSFGKKYLVQIDIANFYPSIYSHSVPWALVNKFKNRRQITKIGRIFLLFNLILYLFLRSTGMGPTKVTKLFYSIFTKGLIEFKQRANNNECKQLS
jgi:hypothetical protein